MNVGIEGLEGNARMVAVEVLNHCLADEIALGLALKQAHWTMKGPNFIAVHELVDEIHARVQEQVDVIAERVQILDGTAMGTLEAVAKATEVKPYPTDAVKIADHVEALGARMRAVGATLRAGIDTVDAAGDAGSADILTAASRQIDKDLWFLVSHAA
ncbi:MAG: DNA starvation/stationary phase protection protein Dps [Sphingomonadales bacterium]|nr:DNA starvation/stationary phase protection protein Dps [Sphingomonadales bacterium]